MPVNDPNVPWYAGGASSVNGGPQLSNQYQNDGNDLSSILGQAGLADNVYFGGGPSSAAAATAYYQNMANQAQNQSAAQINPTGTAMAEGLNNTLGTAYGAAAGANTGAMGQQNQALGYLGQAAAGKGPSAAQAQLQQGTAAAINANMAMANSARGGAGLANAQKNALAQNGAQTQQAANQSAQLRAQEMQAAQSQYGQMANQAQNQYAQQQLGFAGAQQGAIGMANQNFNNQAQLQEQQNSLNQQGALAYQQLGFNAQAEQLQAMEANQQAANQLNQANAKNMSSGIGGIMGAVGGVAMLSDRTAKKNVKDASGDIDEALSGMAPHSFEYTDAKYGAPGEHTGIMAQELAGSDAGRRMLTPGPDGKMAVKIPEATSFSLGALARLNDRLDALEGRFGAPGGTRVGESKFREPHGGDAQWTLREEPNFMLAKNDRTGDVQKVATEPLSESEKREAFERPHGAGPLSEHADGMLGGLLGGGSSAPTNTAQAPVQGTNPNAAVSPQMLGMGTNLKGPMPNSNSGGGGSAAGGSGDNSFGSSFNSAFNSTYGAANALDSAAGGMWSGGI